MGALLFAAPQRASGASASVDASVVSPTFASGAETGSSVTAIVGSDVPSAIGSGAASMLASGVGAALVAAGSGEGH